MRLEDKSAIVTGGGNGIGRGISLAFAAEGAKIAVVDLDGSAAEDVAREIDSTGGTAFPVTVDVADAEGVQRMATTVADAFGGIDVLVNNAGKRIVKTFLDHTLEDWQTMLDVNLTSQFLCTHAVLPYMLERGEGKVVNIASVAGHIGRPDRVAYCAAKSGILGLTRAFAADMAGTEIRVNSISPGSINSPMNAQFANDPDLDWGGETLVGRWGVPDDVAKAALYLASDDCDFMTGADIRIDGGWTSARARDGELG